MEETNHILYDIDKDNDAVNERLLRDTRPLRDKSSGSVDANGIRGL